MAHGHPDYGVQSSIGVIHKVQDLGELAARIWSPDRFDRRGNVIFMDTFDQGLQSWDQTTQGTGAAINQSIYTSLHGPCSCELTAGSDGNKRAMLDLYIPYPVLSIFGVELSFHIASYTDVLTIYMYFYDGTNLYTFAFRYDDTNNELHYLNSSGSWVTQATGLVLSSQDFLFHFAKLVVDPENAEYVRLIVNNTTHDLSDIPCRQQSNSGGPYVDIEIDNVGRAGNNDAVYIGHVIVTQNEV